LQLAAQRKVPGQSTPTCGYPAVVEEEQLDGHDILEVTTRLLVVSYGPILNLFQKISPSDPTTKECIIISWAILRHLTDSWRKFHFRVFSLQPGLSQGREHSSAKLQYCRRLSNINSGEGVYDLVLGDDVTFWGDDVTFWGEGEKFRDGMPHYGVDGFEPEIVQATCHI
jgi:hypothetical protein